MAVNRKKAFRDDQIAKSLQIELIAIIESARDRNINELEIIRVQPRPGGKHFLVFFGPPRDGDQVFTESHDLETVSEHLARAKGFIRSTLTETMNLKFAPGITFVPDPIQWAK